MGSGYAYHCTKCGHEYEVHYGIGFLFPEQYEEVMKAVRTGKYGEEWKALAAGVEYVAVDAEAYVYLCRKCGAWKEEPGLSLFVPKGEAQMAAAKDRERDAKKWNDAPYVTPWELRADYKLLKRRIHKCDKCGSVMHRMSEEELLKLPCPKCGGEPEFPVALRID